jgi:hypothetical protein
LGFLFFFIFCQKAAVIRIPDTQEQGTQGWGDAAEEEVPW